MDSILPQMDNNLLSYSSFSFPLEMKSKGKISNNSLYKLQKDKILSRLLNKYQTNRLFNEKIGYYNLYKISTQTSTNRNPKLRSRTNNHSIKYKYIYAKGTHLLSPIPKLALTTVKIRKLRLNFYRKKDFGKYNNQNYESVSFDKEKNNSISDPPEYNKILAPKLNIYISQIENGELKPCYDKYQKFSDTILEKILKAKISSLKNSTKRLVQNKLQ